VEDKARDDASARSALDWAARVQRLEAEVDGLRRAMRSRAIIEQAKGFLSAALNCGLDEAFGHLARLSQHENLKVVEVAARIIGAAMPSDLDDPAPAEPAIGDAQPFDPLTYLHGRPPTEDTGEASPESVDLPVLPAETRVRLQTAAAAVQSAGTLPELAERLLDEGTRWLGAKAVTIWTSAPDGALELAAYAGISPQEASDWQRIPSRVRAPVRDAISMNEPVWVDGAQPHEYAIMRDGTALAGVPLRDGGRPFGGLVVQWEQKHPFAEPEQRYLAALGALAARRYGQLARTDGRTGTAPGHWLPGVLDALPVATLLLAPVREGPGRIVDFVIDYASPLAGEPYEQASSLAGRMLLDVWPHLATSDVFEAYRHVAVAGGTWQQPARPETILVDGVAEQRTISRSAVRLGEGLLVAWRTHDAEAQLTRLSRMEDLGDLGFVEWDLVSGGVYWSPGLYRIFDRSPQRGPLSLDHIPDHVVPADLPALENDLRTLLEQRLSIDTWLRLRIGGGERPIRVVIQPVLDDHDELVAVYALVQDLTDISRRNETQRRTEHAAKVRKIHGGVTPRREW